MKANKIASCASEALAEPRVLQLAEGLFCVGLEVMKIIPARHILHKAWDEGLIGPGSLVVESSSGNLALGLAIVARELGVRLHIVGDPAIDPHLRNMLHNLGATVDIVEQPDARGSFQRLRLERIHDVLRRHPGAFWVRQYDNRGNPDAYGALAARLQEYFGPRFGLVASVGSGGSSVGLVRALRERGAAIEMTGVDTFNSVLFGLPDGKRTLRGLGNSVMPGVLDHQQFDAVHWLGSDLGEGAARALHANHGLLCGPTSGAAYLVAQYLARRGDPAQPTVFVAPDHGYRYLNTVYAGAWPAVAAPLQTLQPVVVGAPHEVDPACGWAALQWQRRSLEQVLQTRYAVSEDER